MSTAVTAVVFVALFASHQVGDHIVQTSAAAQAKGAPTADLLAAGVHPWRGWGACLHHVSTYTLTQAAALVLVNVATPVAWTAVLAALAVSASTHAVIDRRWLVRLIVRAKGCQDWQEAPYAIDQSLHTGAMLVAAVVAAVTTSGAGACAVGAGAAALVGIALVVEQRLATAARDRAASTSGG